LINKQEKTTLQRSIGIHYTILHLICSCFG